VETIRICFVGSVMLAALISIGKVPITKVEFAERADLIKDVLSRKHCKEMLEGAGKILKSEYKQAIEGKFLCDGSFSLTNIFVRSPGPSFNDCLAISSCLK